MPPPLKFRKLPGSCLTCLPALRTLCLDNWDLSLSSFSFCLPDLTTLRLSGCSKLPVKIWNFPALVSLELDDVDYPQNMSDIFPTLVNLQNLTIYLTRSFMEQHHSISCPQLLNLNIKIYYYDSRYGNIKVLTPKLCNFTSFGILSITFEAPELVNANIKLRGWFGNMDWIYRKKCYRLLTDMLSGLGNAKNLTFDSETIEALSAADFLASLPSPFCNLKIVKLPRGYKESSIFGPLRSYILGGSPRATIVTTESHHCHNIASVEGTDTDQASSSMGDGDFRLWQGHEVNSKFVCLLDCIMHKYPETFEHFTTKNRKLCTMNLNMLCTSLNDFTKIAVTDVDSEMIVWYRDVFACLQNQGLNISWVVNRLNYIEYLRFSKPLNKLISIDCHIDDAKTKLQKLQASCDDAKIKLQDLQVCVDDAKANLQEVLTLRVEKLTEIERTLGNMGPKLAVGFIGDGLLSV